MIGILVTGHGDFSLGVAHALEMIAGKQHEFCVVPFDESAPLSLLETQMRQETETLLKETDGVVIFADLLGGTPFKTAMEIAADYEMVEVVVGVNLPMLVEVVIAREFETDPIAIVQKSIAAGNAGLQHVTLPTVSQKKMEEDGI